MPQGDATSLQVNGSAEMTDQAMVRALANPLESMVLGSPATGAGGVSRSRERLEFDDSHRAAIHQRWWKYLRVVVGFRLDAGSASAWIGNDLGFTWYSLIDQVDWDTALGENDGHVNESGLYDLPRNERKVAKEYRALLQESSQITIVPKGEMLELTKQPAMLKVEVWRSGSPRSRPRPAMLRCPTRPAWSPACRHGRSCVASTAGRSGRSGW